MSWIQTYTRKRFDFRNPRPQDICIQDIAQGLSHICRFAGQTDRFYSVLEHSWHVSYLVPAEHALVGLLHDAPEAYMVDLPKPLKDLLPAYECIEHDVWRVIATKFGMPLVMPDCVKTADIQMLLLERDVLMGGPIEPWVLGEHYKPANRSLCGWRPDVARDLFLKRFRELVN